MLEQIIEERLKKLRTLREAGVDPYPPRVTRTHALREALAKFDAYAADGTTLSLAGRAMSLRDQGGVVFLDLRDESGMIQAVLKKDALADFDLWQANLDTGDYVSVTGKLFMTQRGQKSIAATAIQLAAKSLRPLPSAFYGVEETELRLRQRYLDLLLNPETTEMFRKKTLFWDTIRAFLKKQGFTEVELPVLERVPGGAEAEPFKTHHNALDTDFYLRISLELPLKKLLVGGLESVFEIGRIFRNEGIDREHLQDYTQLEFYWAYRDYNNLMRLTEKMYKLAVQKVTGGTTTVYGEHAIDWGGKWPKVNYVKAFKTENGIDPTRADMKKLRARADELGLSPEPSAGKGRLIDMIFKKTVRPKLVQPCFLIDPPVEIEPLAKRSPKNPRCVERMQVMAGGTELGKGFSELNDPQDQRARFEEQMRLREAGDKEAQQLDEEYLTAMEYGMPPAAGFGMSERFFSVLMNKPIRETVFFPLMRPKVSREFDTE